MGWFTSSNEDRSNAFLQFLRARNVIGAAGYLDDNGETVLQTLTFAPDLERGEQLERLIQGLDRTAWDLPKDLENASGAALSASFNFERSIAFSVEGVGTVRIVQGFVGEQVSGEITQLAFVQSRAELLHRGRVIAWIRFDPRDGNDLGSPEETLKRVETHEAIFGRLPLKKSLRDEIEKPRREAAEREQAQQIEATAAARAKQVAAAAAKQALIDKTEEMLMKTITSRSDEVVARVLKLARIEQPKLDLTLAMASFATILKGSLSAKQDRRDVSVGGIVPILRQFSLEGATAHIALVRNTAERFMSVTSGDSRRQVMRTTPHVGTVELVVEPTEDGVQKVFAAIRAMTPRSVVISNQDALGAVSMLIATGFGEIKLIFPEPGAREHWATLQRKDTATSVTVMDRNESLGDVRVTVSGAADRLADANYKPDVAFELTHAGVREEAKIAAAKDLGVELPRAAVEQYHGF